MLAAEDSATSPTAAAAPTGGYPPAAAAEEAAAPAPQPPVAPGAAADADAGAAAGAEALDPSAEAAPAAQEASPAEGEEDAAEGSPSSGWVGRMKGKAYEKVAPTVQKVSEMESVQKGVQYIVDKSKVVQQKVSESERVQQSVEFVRKKTTELAESERFQKTVEKAKDTAKAVGEKTTQGIEIAKEKTKALREKAGEVWQRGGGTISKVRSSVSTMSWKGNARDTLDIAAREEMWKNIRVQGAEEFAVPARTEHTSAYHVSKGATLRWTFRVKDNDIGFGVRMRVQEWGGSREDEVLAVERYDCADTISGSWVADEDRTIVLAFDNRYSRLRAKTVAFIVGTEKPPVFTEPPAQAPDAAPSDPAAGPPCEPAAKAIV